MWPEVAMTVFVCTSMNHLGLIGAVEKAVGFKLPIINCCKCSSFWATILLLYLYPTGSGMLASIAIAFLAAMAAVWLELVMGVFDTLYDKIYERVFNAPTVTKADGGKAGAETGDTGDTETKVS